MNCDEMKRLFNSGCYSYEKIKGGRFIINHTANELHIFTDRIPDFGDLLSQVVDAAVSFHQRGTLRDRPRRQIKFCAAVLRTLERIEHRGHAVIVVSGQRIELVVVTPSTAQRDAEERLRRRANDVVELVVTILLEVRRFVVKRAEPMKAGCDHGLGRSIRQFIAGELLDEKSVIRLVGVERVNHVIAISPDARLGGVSFVTVRLGVAHKVQPMPSPAFAVARPAEQVVDQSFNCCGRFVREELILLLNGRRQAGQVERRSSQQIAAFRRMIWLPTRLFKFRQDESINRRPHPVSILHRRNHWPNDGPKRPMLTIGIGDLVLLRFVCPKGDRQDDQPQD